MYLCVIANLLPPHRTHARTHLNRIFLLSPRQVVTTCRISVGFGIIPYKGLLHRRFGQENLNICVITHNEGCLLLLESVSGLIRVLSCLAQHFLPSAGWMYWICALHHFGGALICLCCSPHLQTAWAAMSIEFYITLHLFILHSFIHSSFIHPSFITLSFVIHFLDL